MNIKGNTKAAVVAALLTAGSLMPITASHAAVSVQFDAGNVAFGYSDGYWDRSKQWHRWPSRAARSDWRTHNKAHYSSRAHTHANGWGWNDSNRYWEH